MRLLARQVRERQEELAELHHARLDRALDDGVLSYPAATQMLGLQASHLGELRKALSGRTSH